jgi:hypothetical protein
MIEVEGKVKIEASDQKLELSIDEAKKLRDRLNLLFPLENCFQPLSQVTSWPEDISLTRVELEIGIPHWEEIVWGGDPKGKMG